MKLLILSSSTGGGHDMRASALLNGWNDHGHEGCISRPLDDGFLAYRMGADFYNFIQVKMPWFHQFYFRFLEYANLHRRASTILGTSRFQQQVRNFCPDLVLSVHAHLNHGFFDLVSKASSKSLKSIVYCGELADGPGFSRHWINPKVDLFVGPTSETCEAAVKRGMPREKVKNCGLLLRSPFYAKLDECKRVSCLKDLKIDSSQPFLLLATGANGANRHLEICRRLAEAQVNIPVVALCGNDLGLKRKLTEFDQNQGLRVLALPKMGGEQMFHLLHSALCMVGRPGAGLTSEALACGTPMVFDLSRGVMPQESNNLNFWKSRGEGVLTMNEPNLLPNVLGQKIPRIRIELPSSPSELILLLEALGPRDD